MKKTIQTLALLAAISLTTANNCVYKDEESGQVFDLAPLTNEKTDWKVVSLMDGKEYVFNFCKFTTNPCGSDWKQAMAYRQHMLGSKNECEVLTQLKNDKFSLAVETTQHKALMSAPEQIISLH